MNIPFFLKTRFEAISEDEVCLLVGKHMENFILEIVCYNVEFHENYKEMLPKGLIFIGYAAKSRIKEEEEKKLYELFFESFLFYDCSNNHILKIKENQNVNFEFENSESFVKRINFTFIFVEIPQNLQNDFFCKFENLNSELFFTSELSAFKTPAKNTKTKGKSTKKPELKENPFKDFMKNLKLQTKNSLEESIKLNKSFFFPLQKVQIFSNNSNFDEEISLEFKPNFPENSNSQAFLSLFSFDLTIEETLEHLIVEIKQRSKFPKSNKMCYNEFFAFPLTISNEKFEWLQKIARIPENWKGKFPCEMEFFEGKPINVHKNLQLPKSFNSIVTIRGSYAYFHYLQDGFNDEGWGCAYRSLQTLLSWFVLSSLANFPFPRQIKRIQELVLTMGDQGPDFVGSTTWIGSIEVGYVLSLLTNYEHRILFVQDGNEILTHVRALSEHFRVVGSPVMLGGADYAYTLLGIAENGEDTKFLILDPHYTGTDDGKAMYDRKGIAWRGTDLFKPGNYYNFCLPTLTRTVN